MANFESCLNREILRRDAALMRMRTACSATKCTVKRETENIKGDLNRLKQEFMPRAVVQHRPWASVLGAIAAGLGAALLVKGLFGRNRRPEYSQPQRVVVQVEGAGAKEVKQPAAASPWKAILDAAMSGLPVLLAFAETQLMQQAPQNGNGHSQTSETPEKAATAAANTATDPVPFKSISRRTAPPPREG